MRKLALLVPLVAALLPASGEAADGIFSIPPSCVYACPAVEGAPCTLGACTQGATYPAQPSKRTPDPSTTCFKVPIGTTTRAHLVEGSLEIRFEYPAERHTERHAISLPLVVALDDYMPITPAPPSPTEQTLCFTVKGNTVRVTLRDN